MRKVNLIVNTYERTYKRVLSEGFFPNIEEQNKYVFKKRILIINNVVSQEDMISRLDKITNRGEVDEYYFVSDHIDRALKETGLTTEDLGKLQYYNNWALVAVFISKNDWFLHWDAEIYLRKPVNWIEPSIRLMENDGQILAANPSFDPEWIRQSVKKGTVKIFQDFAIGYGFSDQIFLVHGEQLCRPIYKERCLASLRFPLAHIGSIFEKRIDAYMRNNRRLRAIYMPAIYVHPPETHGILHPTEAGLMEKFLKMRNEYIHRKLRNRYISFFLNLIGKDYLIV